MSDHAKENTEEPLVSPTDWVADHVRRYVESDGADGHIMNGVPCALITHRGRVSGRLRRTPLVYGRDGDRIVIIASRGGSDHHPAWFQNLQADPSVHVQILGEHFLQTVDGIFNSISIIALQFRLLDDLVEDVAGLVLLVADGGGLGY